MFLVFMTKQTTSTKCQKSIARSFFIIILAKLIKETNSTPTNLEIKQNYFLKKDTTILNEQSQTHSKNTSLRDTQRPKSIFRLINQSKNEIGKVNNHFAEKMNSDIMKKLQFNQWRNTDFLLKWFNNITDTSN